MTVDVLYDGLTVATGAEARQEGGALVVSMANPLPVGTRLTVRLPDGEKVARVERVQEHPAAQVTLKLIDGAVAGYGAPPEANAEPPTDPNALADEPAEAADSGRKGRKRKKTGRIERQ